MVDLRLRYPALRFPVVRTFAGGRLRPRPRSTPTKSQPLEHDCVEPASLCLQRDNVARALTTVTTLHRIRTADALI